MEAGISAIFGIGMFFVVCLVSLLLTAFWIWMLVDAIRNKGVSDGEKVAWVLAIVFLPFIGSLLYCIIGRSKGRQPRS